MNGISIVSDTNPLIYLDLPLLTFDSDFTRVPDLKLFILEK
jgi:hypothetical protein